MLQNLGAILALLRSNWGFSRSFLTTTPALALGKLISASGTDAG
jgi:hypothetical protein